MIPEAHLYLKKLGMPLMLFLDLLIIAREKKYYPLPSYIE
nr:MAG TPA: hypothetical protein [Caudoviricetes sp.]